jgi:peptidoglycan hydrolase CwlO-like protein
MTDSTAGAAPTPEHHRSRGLIILCIVLVVVAAGLAIWALSLNSDLNAQKDKTAAAQQQADTANSEIDSLAQQVDDISQSLQDAGGTAQQALEDLKSKFNAAKEQIRQAIEDAGNSGDSG